MIAPALGHLTDTKYATNEDGGVGETQASNEDLEALIIDELDGGGFEACAVCAGSDDIVCDQRAENEECEDLPDDTGHHEVVTCFL